MLNQPASILVVDDTPANLTLMTGLLQDTYHVRAAISGEKALKIASSENPPDLILLDIMMPEMDGYVLTKNIKSDSRFEGVPVVMHSSLSSEANRAMGKSVGVDAYVAKFDAEALADTLRPLIER